MNIIRRVGLGICAMVLGLALLGLAWSHVVHSTIQDKDTVKSWLEDSGFYDNITDSLIEQAEEDSEESLPIDQPEVEAAIDEAFSPDFLRENANKVLDGVYAWADGETDQPEFSVDLTDAKQRLIDGLSSYAVRRAGELPRCSVAQSREMAGQFDVLEADCLPMGVSPEQAGVQVRSELESSKDFLPDTSLAPDNLKDESGQVVVWPNSLRDVYQRSKAAMFVMAALSVLAAVGVLFASATKRKGLQRIGAVLISSGLVVGLSAFIFGRGPAWLGQKLNNGGQMASQLLADMLDVIGRDVSGLLWWYAGGFVLLGVIGLLLAKFWKRPTAKDTVAPVTSQPIGSERSDTAVGESQKESPKIQL